MIARAESVQNWLENVTYQMNNMVSNSSLLILFVVLNIFYQIGLQGTSTKTCRVRS